MRRVLSTILAVALLLGLGALAVLALPNANATLAPVSAAAPEFATEAITGPRFNMIAMPLKAASQFTSAGYTYTADGLMKLGGTGVKQVGHWRPDLKIYETWTYDPDVGGGVGTDFGLKAGQAYWMLLESAFTGSVISFVGDVPDKGEVTFTLGRSSPCAFNELSIPLDQSTITDANHLMTALNAQQVSRWVAADQRYESWTYDPDVGGGVGTNFTTNLGYPYVVCLLSGTPTVWP